MTNRSPKLLMGLLLAGALACTDTTPPPTGAGPAFDAAGGAAAPGQYIVVLREGTRDVPGLARLLARQHGGTEGFVYQHALQGFSVTLPSGAAEALARHPDVALVEPDAIGGIVTTQLNPPSWGLDRVDQRNLPLSSSYTYTSTGSGVNVYILDTGVRRTHSDFGGRVTFVPNGSNGDFVGDGRGSAEDCHGHGTHTAGTSAGNSYGIAKAASIWAARVVNCQGSGNVSMAIAAVDWVTANAARPAVVNMSLGYGDVQSLRTAVENSVASGVVYSVSAGNGNFAGVPQNACKQSPAGAPSALTVGATDRTDKEASFSNYGTCVDLLAPGVSIVSDYYTSDVATATMSGTSMSAPHVTGVSALYLSLNPAATPAQVSSALTLNASLNKISLHSRSRRNGTPNRLLFTNY